MFWKKKNPEEKAMEKKIKRNVEKVSDRLWGYMVSDVGINVDELSKMKRVAKKITENDRNVTYIRIFDPGKAEQVSVTVTEYNDLNEHPDLIVHSCRAYIDQQNEIIIESVRS